MATSSNCEAAGIRVPPPYHPLSPVLYPIEHRPVIKTSTEGHAAAESRDGTLNDTITRSMTTCALFIPFHFCAINKCALHNNTKRHGYTTVLNASYCPDYFLARVPYCLVQWEKKKKQTKLLRAQSTVNSHCIVCFSFNRPTQF